MDRRGFLNALTAFAGTAVLDPERLLWAQTKTIFIPKPAEYRWVTVNVNEEEYKSLDVDALYGIDIEYTDSQLALTIEEFNDRYVLPAIQHYIDLEAGGPGYGYFELKHKPTRQGTGRNSP